MADGRKLDQVRGHVFGVGFARQAAPVAVGAAHEEDEIEGRVGRIGQFSLLAGVERAELLRLLEVVHLLERGVGVGADAPPLQVAGNFVLQHVGQEEDADDAGVVAHLGADAMHHVEEHARTRAAAQAADDIDELEVADDGEAAVLRDFHVADLVQVGQLGFEQLLEVDVVAEETEPPDGAKLLSPVVDVAKRDGGVVPPLGDLRVLV